MSDKAFPETCMKYQSCLYKVQSSFHAQFISFVKKFQPYETLQNYDGDANGNV